MLKFKDGVEFDAQGPYRIVEKIDGYYVVGHGMISPAKNEEEAEELLLELKRSEEN